MGDARPTSEGSEGPRRPGDAPPPVVLSNHFEDYWRSKLGRSPRAAEPGERVAAPRDRAADRPPAPARTATDSPAPERVPAVFTDLERSTTLDRFAEIFADRLGDALSSGKLAAAWQNPGGSSMFAWLWTDHSPDSKETSRIRLDPADYAAERNMIQPHLAPMIWGSGCMAITLFSLRAGRWYQGGAAANALGHGLRTAGRTGAPPRSPNVGALRDVRRAPPHPNGHPFDPRKAQSERDMSSLGTLPVDFAVSMLVGISAAVFLTTPVRFMKDLSKAPSLEGKSVLAEELCAPFRQEMERVNRGTYAYTPHAAAGAAPARRRVVPYADLWREEHLGDFESLRAVREFVARCRARERRAEARGGGARERDAAGAGPEPQGTAPASCAAGE